MKVPARSFGAFVALLFAISAVGQTPPDFTGRWRRQTSVGEQRQFDIRQQGNTLKVETTITSSNGTRRSQVTYLIGGPETVYKGTDGDEFHSRVHWDGRSLIFEIVEHERGEQIPEIAVWTLSNDGMSIQVKRQSTKSGKNSSVSYARVP